MSESKSAVTRRAAMAVFGVGLVAPALVSPLQAAETGDAAGVAKAVEDLRAAMVAGDGKKMASLLSENLSYGHSDAHLETKAQFIKNLEGPNAPGKFKTLNLSNQVIIVDGNNATVRHTFDGVNILPDGKETTAHIHVMQVWKKQKGAWRLLARQSVPLKS